MRIEEFGKNLLTRNWMNLFLIGSTKDVVKAFGCQEYGNMVWEGESNEALTG